MSKQLDTAAQAFIVRKSGKSGAFVTDYGIAKSYDYVLASHDSDGSIVVSYGGHPYAGSATTNKHRRAVIRAAEDAGIVVKRHDVIRPWDRLS